jgi:hypothetical protein
MADVCYLIDREKLVVINFGIFCYDYFSSLCYELGAGSASSGVGLWRSSSGSLVGLQIPRYLERQILSYAPLGFCC